MYSLAVVAAAFLRATPVVATHESAADAFTFVAASSGNKPVPFTGHGFDHVLASNDGSGSIWACSRSGTIEAFSLSREGRAPMRSRGGSADVRGCRALTYLHGSVSGGTMTPHVAGLVAATDAGLAAYNITGDDSGGAGGGAGRLPSLTLRHTSTVPPPTGGAVTALRLFRHFQSARGTMDSDALIAGASTTGEIFAATVGSDHSLHVAKGTMALSRLANTSGSGAPEVGGFVSWDFMGISMYLGVTFRAGGVVLNGVQVSGHDNLEPTDPSSWRIGGISRANAPAGFPTQSGCGDTIEHNDLIYVACSEANAVLVSSLESGLNPVLTVPFPGKHARGLLLVGDALFVAGGNDVVVYDLSKLNSVKITDPPPMVGRCGVACARIFGTSAQLPNAHGMAYQYQTTSQTHQLVRNSFRHTPVSVTSVPHHSMRIRNWFC